MARCAPLPALVCVSSVVSWIAVLVATRGQPAPPAVKITECTTQIQCADPFGADFVDAVATVKDRLRTARPFAAVIAQARNATGLRSVDGPRMARALERSVRWPLHLVAFAKECVPVEVNVASASECGWSVAMAWVDLPSGRQKRRRTRSKECNEYDGTEGTRALISELAGAEVECKLAEKQETTLECASLGSGHRVGLIALAQRPRSL